MMLIISILILILYCLLIYSIFHDWSVKIKGKDLESKVPSNINISVVVIGRNEENSIQGCLQSILDNDFPTEQYEIIYIDDHSEDRSLEIASNLNASNLHILQLKNFVYSADLNAYKKAAIQYAHQVSKYDLILHTDADCLVPINWLSDTAKTFINEEIHLQTAPVLFQEDSSFLTWFQQLDMYTLIATTLSGIKKKQWYLGNGANLAYRKSSLPKNIFTEAKQFASGDDLYLIDQIAQLHPNGISFNSNIPVSTEAEKYLGSFINQRIRWAGKNRDLVKGKMKNILLIPVIFNFWFLTLLVITILSFRYNFWAYNPSLLFGLFFLGKLIVDYCLIYKVHNFFHPRLKMKWFLGSFLLYPFYLIGIGTLSIFKRNYTWKGRKVC